MAAPASLRLTSVQVSSAMLVRHKKIPSAAAYITKSFQDWNFLFAHSCENKAINPIPTKLWNDVTN